MSYRTEPRTLEEKIAALQEQLREQQSGLATLVVTNVDLSPLATSAGLGDAELLGWLGLVMA